MRRTTLMAAAVATWCRCVRSCPMERERRNPMVRTPCEIVPSTPARVAYRVLKSLVLSRLSPGLQRLVLLLGSDGDGAAHMAQRLRAEPQAGTRLTVFGGAFARDRPRWFGCRWLLSS